MSTQAIASDYAIASGTPSTPDALLARLERLPITRRLKAIRVIVGLSTFFDAYTIIAIAFALPQLTQEWGLTPTFVGLIIAASYVGQLCGALFFGSLAEKIGRIGVLRITIIMFVLMDAACLFAWNGWSILIIRFLQGVGIGAEVPVASAYINEFVGAKKRGRFFLLYEVIFPIGMMFAGLVGYFLVPIYGWKVMFLIGLVPSALTVPLRWLMPESPRWLAAKGRLKEADNIVSTLESEVIRRGMTLPEPEMKAPTVQKSAPEGVKALFGGIYKSRTFMLWGLWLTVYSVNNGMITWFPTLYKTWFNLSLDTSLAYGWIPSSCGVVASVICALLIDRVGRKRWYTWAFLLAIVPLITLSILGAKSAVEILILGSLTYAILQTIAFSLYLYAAELYPTRLRAIGTAYSSAWLRAGSSIGPLMVGFIVSGFGIRFVFITFAVIALIGGLITWFFAIETKGKSLEELSP
ncbi:TPA: MFS transporter [Klebsiella aerogenes]